jgi:integrase
MSKSTTSASRRKSASGKPKCPRCGKEFGSAHRKQCDFPLFSHGTGRWAKKIRGKLEYFGYWADRKNGQLVRLKGDGWQEALDLYKKQADDLHAGRIPRDNDDEPTLRDLCNAFLQQKASKLESGELSPTTFSDYRLACDRLIEHFGKFRRLDDLRPEDFGQFRKMLAAGRSITTLKNNINLCRIVLKFGYDQGMIDRPIRFGQSFDKPSNKNMRKARNEAGPKLYTRDELLKIIDNADPFLKAMVLLGINGGLGNTDLANLPQSAIDWKSGWLDYPRPKTAVDRRIPLWKETIDALKVAIDARPKPKDTADADLCFLTVQGNRWVRTMPSKSRKDRYVRRDTVGSRFGALLKELKINGRKGLGFYTLRHNFETVAGGCKDQVGVDAIMGHADNSMASHYREGIDDDRLQAVTQHVHGWLWPKKDTKRKKVSEKDTRSSLRIVG